MDRPKIRFYCISKQQIWYILLLEENTRDTIWITAICETRRFKSVIRQRTSEFITQWHVYSLLVTCRLHAFDLTSNVQKIKLLILFLLFCSRILTTSYRFYQQEASKCSSLSDKGSEEQLSDPSCCGITLAFRYVNNNNQGELYTV